MATSQIPVTPGSGKNVATHSFTEDAATKELQRIVLSNSSGVDQGTASNPVYVQATVNTVVSGNNIYSNVYNDFTATANSGAKTITLSSYASTALSSIISARSFANAKIYRVSSAGAVDALPLTNVSFSSNILTLSDMSANFASGDTVAVFVAGPDKSYDETNEWTKVSLASQLDENNDKIRAVMDGYKSTYVATATGVASASSCTDLFTIYGSSSKTVRVNRIIISGTQTTGGVQDILVIKRSTADSSGTSSTLTNVPLDSNNAAATATVKSYTANPTTGTAVGTIVSRKVFVSATTATPEKLVLEFGKGLGQVPVLRGTSEGLVVNLNGVTVTGGSFSFEVEWTEES